MKSIDFPERNAEIGKGQPEYEVLYAKVNTTDPARPVICCFELSDEEIAQLVATKQLWYTQLTFDHLFQPVMLSTLKPQF